MTNYLTANRDKIDGHDRPRRPRHRQRRSVSGTRSAWRPGEIPVVGWGNSLDTAQEILDGYVLAGMWQDPQMTSYLGLSLAAAASAGIPPGFDIMVGALYEKDTAQVYLDIMSQ